MMQLQNYTFLHLVYTLDTRSYVSLWRWRNLKIPLRWSCLHFGIAADYLQSRSSILEKNDP